MGLGTCGKDVAHGVKVKRAFPPSERMQHFILRAKHRTANAGRARYPQASAAGTKGARVFDPQQLWMKLSVWKI
jgi:hypothetical protein